jgi:hypothetical protein
VQDIELANLPKEQIEKYLQEWTTALVEYKKNRRRSAIKEANKIIGELEAALASHNANNNQPLTNNV